MPRTALIAALLILAVPATARAQDTLPTSRPVTADTVRATGGWNDARTMALVRRAVERRAVQLADTGLVDYHATAHGYLTFLAQLGEGFPEPPRVVKADELALDVWWKAPDRSRQRIVGRRDTLLLPTDINYHRDHLGIVQNNFPDIIRLGDGDEVLDVPHPLSGAGLAAYDFAIGDSVRIRLPDRVIRVFSVRVRPRDDRLPRAVGAVFIDTSEAQVVRMAFSFTRSALKDQQLEDVSIVLENALVDGRFWLPRRQEIEIRRTGSFLDYPARGIIRGRWEICCYEVNRGLPDALFAGPEITQAPPRVLQQYKWATPRLLDSLPPDVRAVTDEDVRRVQEEARELVRAQALARARRPTLSARAVSDFVRVNRAEGLALGAGLARAFGGGLSGALRGRYGFEDEEAKALLALEWRRASGAGLRLEGYRDYRDASDVAEVSMLRNSIAAQEAGSDYTEPYDVRGATLWGDLPPWWGLRARLGVSFEAHDPVRVADEPESGRYERTLPVTPMEAGRATLRIERPTALAWVGTEMRLAAEVRASRFEVGEIACGLGPCDFSLRSPAGEHTTGRASLDLGIERPVGGTRLVLRSVVAGAVGPHVPVQELAFAGGPTTGPGYEYHQFVGRLVGSQRVEWQLPVPFVAVPLGRFGRTAPRATLAPFVHAVYVARPAAFQPARHGWYPAVGVGTLVLFDLLRFDVARGLRDGRWTFSVDAARAFWPVL